MIKRFKELWFGIAFGIGAIFIDAAMHATMSGSTFLEELFSARPEMLFYRALFLSFGLSLGWMIWLNNRKEREFRDLKNAFDSLRSEMAPVLVMSYSRLLLLLGNTEVATLPPEATRLLGEIQADVRRLKDLVEKS